MFGTDRHFIAPDLIFHYVYHHHYRPPMAFVRALFHSPLPTERVYLERLRGEFPGRDGEWREFVHWTHGRSHDRE